MSVVSLLIISALLSISCAQAVIEFLAPRSAPDSNLFRLECVTDTSDTPNPAAIFMVDGMDVRDLAENPPVINPGGSSSFFLTRELEGSYSCSSPTSGATSNSVQLVGEWGEAGDN